MELVSTYSTIAWELGVNDYKDVKSILRNLIGLKSKFIQISKSQQCLLSNNEILKNKLISYEEDFEIQYQIIDKLELKVKEDSRNQEQLQSKFDEMNKENKIISSKYYQMFNITQNYTQTSKILNSCDIKDISLLPEIMQKYKNEIEEQTKQIQSLQSENQHIKLEYQVISQKEQTKQNYEEKLQVQVKSLLSSFGKNLTNLASYFDSQQIIIQDNISDFYNDITQLISFIIEQNQSLKEQEQEFQKMKQKMIIIQNLEHNNYENQIKQLKDKILEIRQYLNNQQNNFISITADIEADIQQKFSYQDTIYSPPTSVEHYPVQE
ncbi:hypothetical protein SS50377_26794 [Spironucleus salmonicida]|uniref:Uncharacterized protein n=1 Tax=Spironucleus salmonicida TaxID=348837 RepID=V6LYE7_9EUKA|nr:hypothetical protein SS50377_26794 [Spironucleus salmonicida]|eukprot:EST49263.1 Hypothetical protein SS50377_10484 [Spironucleus salmonicida]